MRLNNENLSWLFVFILNAAWRVQCHNYEDCCGVLKRRLGHQTLVFLCVIFEIPQASSHYKHNHSTPKLCHEFPRGFQDTAWLYCVVLSPSEEELRKLREEMNSETLKQELEKERLKRLDLEHKMNEILKTRYEKRIFFPGYAIRLFKVL